MPDLEYYKSEIKAKLNRIKDEKQLKQILRLIEDVAKIQPPAVGGAKPRPKAGAGIDIYRDRINLDALPSDSEDGTENLRSLVSGLIDYGEKLEQEL